MAANSWFSSNDSNPNSSSPSCFEIHPYSIIIPSTLLTIFLFLLPLFIFILHHGLQQWRKKSSSSSSSAMSHSDCFTYNMVLMELVAVVGSVFVLYGQLHNVVVIGLGLDVTRFAWFGKLSFHLLTCAERYLAVVHPITYMKLRNSKGIRIRNVSIVFVWMISGAYVYMPYTLYIDQFITAITIAAISFFSLSVLLVLVRPGPGEQGGNRQWADPSKKRAFFTIVAILGVLVLKLSGTYIFVLRSTSNVVCIVDMLLISLELPNSLILPLLFLLRHGRRNKQ